MVSNGFIMFETGAPLQPPSYYCEHVIQSIIRFSFFKRFDLGNPTARKAFGDALEEYESEWEQFSMMTLCCTLHPIVVTLPLTIPAEEHVVRPCRPLGKALETDGETESEDQDEQLLRTASSATTASTGTTGTTGTGTTGSGYQHSGFGGFNAEDYDDYDLPDDLQDLTKDIDETQQELPPAEE